MSIYADTSLLVSYYVNDSNSVQAQTLVNAATAPMIFTGLHRVELRNALALGVFRQILSRKQFRGAKSFCDTLDNTMIDGHEIHRDNALPPGGGNASQGKAAFLRRVAKPGDMHQFQLRSFSCCGS